MLFPIGMSQEQYNILDRNNLNWCTPFVSCVTVAVKIFLSAIGETSNNSALASLNK